MGGAPNGAKGMAMAMVMAMKEIPVAGDVTWLFMICFGNSCF